MRKPALMLVLAAIAGAVIAAPIAVYASHNFLDVPDSNTFHNDIAWLADAGVTRGCNPPTNTEFCPDDAVTRGQMAAFMSRFAGFLGAEDGTPELADHAVTADNATTADSATTAESATTADSAATADSATTAESALTADSATTADTATTADSADDSALLEGKSVAELSPRAAFAVVDDGPDGENQVLTAPITAPAPGVLVATGAVDAFGGPDVYICQLFLDDESVAATGSLMTSQLTADNSEEDCTSSTSVAVGAGTYDVEFNVGSVGGNVSVREVSLWVMWIPFDGTGASPSE